MSVSLRHIIIHYLHSSIGYNIYLFEFPTTNVLDSVHTYESVQGDNNKQPGGQQPGGQQPRGGSEREGFALVGYDTYKQTAAASLFYSKYNQSIIWYICQRCCILTMYAAAAVKQHETSSKI